MVNHSLLWDKPQENYWVWGNNFLSNKYVNKLIYSLNMINFYTKAINALISSTHIVIGANLIIGPLKYNNHITSKG